MQVLAPLYRDRQVDMVATHLRHNPLPRRLVRLQQGQARPANAKADPVQAYLIGIGLTAAVISTDIRGRSRRWMSEASSAWPPR